MFECIILNHLIRVKSTQDKKVRFIEGNELKLAWVDFVLYLRVYVWRNCEYTFKYTHKILRFFILFSKAIMII